MLHISAVRLILMRRYIIRDLMWLTLLNMSYSGVHSGLQVHTAAHTF